MKQHNGAGNSDSATEISPEEAGLNDRERDVLRLLGAGYTNRQIARELHLAEPTVKKYLSRAMRKIDQPDRLRAGLYAYRHLIGG
ncbi:response regulator transcription factor [Marinactinospora rubrisoli]|uniref:Response regulator transcription factor n=1 Tax=Marinactinospora rubrisoli TaxID=2715399 RepID=A0ABW2KCL4_9ACTN